MTDTDRTTCQSCGVPWEEHLGIQGTCRHLHDMRLRLKDATTLIVRLSRAMKKRTDYTLSVDLADKALDWVKRKGISGSILRETEVKHDRN